MADVGYRLRPSKAVQRRMIVDLCRRLSEFGPLWSYQYVGFGGLEFPDFDLVHRELRINEMLSIEGDARKFERCQFNAPFKTIKVLSGSASEKLTEIDWTPLSIVWLDYEKKLNEEIISDVSLVCRSLQPGSVIFITINAVCEIEIAGRRDRFADRVGDTRIPIWVTDESLAVWGLAKAQHEILSNILTRTLRDRVIQADWIQLININYADGAKMQTLGGVVSAAGTQRAFQNCRFEELEFVRFSGNDPLLLRVPTLTTKERRTIEEKLPAGSDTVEFSWLSDADKRDYLQVYRYFVDGQVPT